jgi:serine/threonine protein kinase
MNPPSEETLFAEALALSPAERTAFLDRACAGDPDRRARLEALLAAAVEGHPLLDAAACAATNPPLAPAPAPEAAEQRIGPYRLHQKLGEGGCGTVYLAEQEDPVRRRVALKVIKPGMDTREVIARFEAERQALALMDHPNIARVYDAGTTENGRPYFVMELVQGVPITTFCDERKLAPAARLELFIQVCHAVQHAHQKGIIHRDLKPSNILVARHDDQPVPKVIDFGIAKATAGRLTDQTVFTAVEQFIGTPAYMSPEQAQVSVVDIDTRSDIYSLGVLLYELLTGRTPFDTAELLKIGLDEMRRHIREVDPPRPSTRLSTLQGEALSTTAQRRQIAAPKLVNLIRGDLDWIVMRCLEKDRARRYETANGLAADLLHHLHQEPVTACPPSQWYRLKKLVRRNRLAFGAAAGVTLALLLGLAASVWQAVRAQRAEAATRAEAAVTRAVNDFLVQDLLRQADSRTQADTKIAPDPDLKVREALDRAGEKVGERFKDQPRIEAEIRSAIGSTYRGVGEYGKSVLHLERALELRRRLLGKEHAGTLTAMSNLAAAYQVAGKLELSLPLSEETLKLRKARLGLDHPDTLVSMSNLAAAYQVAGKLELALPLSEETFNLRKAKLGPEHPSTLISMNNLALAYHAAGKLDRALPLHEETLKLRKARLGLDHPDTLNSMNNLALEYKHGGKLNLALPLAEETLKLQQTKLGADHPGTLTAMNNLASTYKAAGRLNMALPLHVEALQLTKAKYGSDHPDTLISMNNVAVAYHDTGKLDLALPLHEETLKLRKAKLGPDHPDTLASMSNLALAYGAAGKRDQALPLLEETLKLRKAKLGSDHPDTLMSMNNLASAYKDAGRLDQTLALYEERLKLTRAKLGAEHSDTLTAMNNLARTYQAAGKLDLALPLYDETLRLRKAKLGPEHADTLATMRTLSLAYEAAREYPQAATLYRELIALRVKKEGAESVQLAADRATLGKILLDTGKFTEAETLLRASLVVREQKIPESWQTGNARHLLGGALAGQKRHAEAEPLLVSGCEEMLRRAEKIPAGTRSRLQQALARTVAFFTETQRPELAAEWQRKLEAYQASLARPAAQPPPNPKQ